MTDLKELKLSENLIETFTELIKKDRLPHAILLDGGDKEKRTAVADYLAASFVCSGEAKPCGSCANCVKAAEHNHADVVMSDPEAQNEKTFKISLVREIREDAFIIPNEAARKVYILKSADKMNIQAQNALLKIIEEPPSYARFIFECESRASMLETIMSRVSAFNLGAGSNETDDKLLIKAEELAIKLTDAIMKPTELEFLRLTGELEKDKELFAPLLSSIQLLFRDAVAVKIGSDIMTLNKDVSKMLASKFSVKTLLELTNVCDDFYSSINKNANRNLLITRFSSVIRQTAYGN